jgi:hypothetical protein
MPREVEEALRCRQTYSQDLRERVIYLRHGLEFKIDEITLVLNMSKRVVERTLQLWRNTGEVMNPQSRKQQKRARVMLPSETEVGGRFIKGLSQADSPFAVSLCPHSTKPRYIPR